jgi:hypothetical protein
MMRVPSFVSARRSTVPAFVEAFAIVTESTASTTDCISATPATRVPAA